MAKKLAGELLKYSKLYTKQIEGEQYCLPFIHSKAMHLAFQPNENCTTYHSFQTTFTEYTQSSRSVIANPYNMLHNTLRYLLRLINQ